jgi:Flp pilus assembly protein protease CpaA
MPTTISNSFNIAVGAAFFVFALLTRMPLTTVGAHAAFAFAVFVVLFVWQPFGGGAMKLVIAIALWLGFGWASVTFYALSMLPCGLYGAARGWKDIPYLPFAVGAIVLMAALGWLPPELRI